MGQMVLADDDFGVDTQISWAAENLRDPPDGSGTATAIADQLGIHDGAFEFGKVRQAFATTGLRFPSREKPFAKSRGEFVAGSKLDVVLYPRIVRNNHTTLRVILKSPPTDG